MFCDSSTFIKYYLNEAESVAVRARLDEAQEVMLSELARVELMSSLHRAMRERRIDRAQFLQVSNTFAQDDLRGAWTWLPVDTAVIAYAAAVYSQLPEKIVLYAADCIHIATALASEHQEIHTHDDEQAKAAEALGLAVVRIDPA
jgi:predicted nucleic acid-binding protein